MRFKIKYHLSIFEKSKIFNIDEHLNELLNAQNKSGKVFFPDLVQIDRGEKPDIGGSDTILW